MVTSQRIRELIQPLLNDSGLVLMDIKLQGSSGRLKITVTLDHRERSILLDECASWSRAFEDVLDSAGDIPRQYALDITSPGLDWPLEEEWQFKKNIGRLLKVTFRIKTADGEKTVTKTMKLLETDAENLIFENEGQVSMSVIENAFVAPMW